MKKLLALTLAVMMVLSLAACGGSDTPAAPSAPTDGSAEAPAADGAPSASGDTIKVGLLANTTGDNAMYGNAVKNGAMLYFDEVNAAGGVNGKQIEVIALDEKGDATEAVTAFNRLLDQGITALVGSVLTGPTIAVADETYPINMPQVTASATAAGVTMIDPEDPASEIRTNIFRSCFIDPFQGEKMAQYANDKLGAKTAAVIFETGSEDVFYVLLIINPHHMRLIALPRREMTREQLYEEMVAQLSRCQANLEEYFELTLNVKRVVQYDSLYALGQENAMRTAH